MKFLIFLLAIPSVLSSLDEFWITPCGHVYKKNVHPLRIVQNAQTLVRLKHHFKAAKDLVTNTDELGILEELDAASDSYVVQTSTLEMYNNIKDVRRLMSLLPMTYRTLQDLAFALKVVHDEMVNHDDEQFKRRHPKVVRLMDQNAQLLCELDFAMNRNNIDFSRIDQLTLSQGLMLNHDDVTFTHMKHSHILKEYRTFIKQVSVQILKLV